ncbi:unnamed protein product, partial [Heterosigma akashiwo]
RRPWARPWTSCSSTASTREWNQKCCVTHARRLTKTCPNLTLKSKPMQSSLITLRACKKGKGKMRPRKVRSDTSTGV